MKIILGLLVALAALFVVPTNAFAAITINSGTLDGASSVTVAPSATITAAVNVTTTGGTNWNSTIWNISGDNCVDHADHTNSGTYDESFSVTAPGSPGTYSISFVSQANNTCGGASSNTYTMSNAITVSSPTPTPGPTSTPAGTSTPGSSSSSSSSSSTVYYPSVTLARSGLSFTGVASVDNGVIDTAEYSLDNGVTWTGLSATDGKFDEEDESFVFTPNTSFTSGAYTVLVRAKSLAQVYTQSANYASVSFTVTPPKVVLDTLKQNPTSDLTPTLTGSASSTFSKVARVEVSLNAGNSWTPAQFSRGVFTLTSQNLEDGNYDVIARAFDSARNMGVSETQTLVVDTLPPIIGGGTFALGPTVLIPGNSTINTITNADITVAVSMKGGVTQAQIISSDKTFDLTNQPGSDIWTGKINFNEGGQKDLTISAVDGADNISKRSFGSLLIQSPGTIKDKSNDKTVDAQVSLYFFDNATQDWVLWEAQSYGQTNPVNTNESGSYSYMVPAGKYYLEVGATGYHKTQSQIFSFNRTTALNYDFTIRSKPTLSLNLPVIGKIVLTIPEAFLPPDSTTLDTAKQTTSATVENLIGQATPNLNLPGLNGTTVNIAGLKGKKLLLTFISPLFPQSLEQASILSDLSPELPGKAQILVVSLQQTLATTQVFMQRGAYKFPAVYDKDGVSAQDFNINFLPKSFLIDENGKIIDIHAGVLNKNEIITKLDNMQ